jgi:beta-1,4-mannosyl-glycoprotein beta-1,4-N-acetylglucosaminyltransferase
MIVDTFMFFNELDVLEMRLRTLDPHVDLFILVESPETHAGNPKPLYFEENKGRFTPWLSKIKHVTSPVLNTPDLWVREKHQRSCILKGFADVPDNAIVMISDVDEIPDMNVLPPLGNDFAKSFHMTMFEYSFDFMFMGEPWIGTVVTTARNVKYAGPNFFRDKRWSFPIVDGGWHCSSFGNAEHVLNKLTNYAHARDTKHKGVTIDQIREYIENGVHADGSMKLVPTPVNMKLPLVKI